MKLTMFLNCTFLMICYCCNAQNMDSVMAESEKTTFPEHWIGSYQGELNIYDTDSIKMQVQMGLDIKKLTDSTYTWIISYLMPEKKDIRNYELQIVDADEGFYKIDEKNGIILGANYFSGTLISRFGVNQSLLDILYIKKGEDIHFQVITGPKTGLKQEIPENESLEIFGFEVANYQNAVLQKKTLSN